VAVASRTGAAAGRNRRAYLFSDAASQHRGCEPESRARAAARLDRIRHLAEHAAQPSRRQRAAREGDPAGERHADSGLHQRGPAHRSSAAASGALADRRSPVAHRLHPARHRPYAAAALAGGLQPQRSLRRLLRVRCPEMAKISIDSDRLWGSLMELARIGATPKGGVRRLALTELDGQARDLFIRWCKDAGCTVTVDGIGNIFARRPGKDDRLPPIITGSHIDTQPSGGKFDGNYGVMSGLEILRTLNDHDVQTQAPIEVAVWTNEEGSRFTPVMMGSGVFVGAFPLESTLQRPDLEGITVGDALTQIGYAGAEKIGGRPVGAYFEAHIEQGPILEDMRKVIGVVL